MTPHELQYSITRRQLLTRTSAGLGAIAASHLLGESVFADRPRGALKDFHFEPEAKRVIFLFMSGGPSHIDLFDPKPQLKEYHGKELPASVRGEQRITLMTRGQKELLVAASPFNFTKFGQSGQEMNEHFVNLGRMADDIAIIRSVFTEPINHDPAVTMMQTGMPQPGRPCIGSWVSYGLGSENKNLPDFVVLLSGQGDQPVLSRYYHSGFLPGKHQGTQFRSQGDAVLFLSDPAGMSHAMRGETVEAINKLNRERLAVIGDPEIEARINSFELAYRMQTSVPELMDISGEPASVHERYGTKPGEATFANNCLLARRLVERGVRFVQLYHRGWDHHTNITENIPKMCGDVDKPCAALLEDLKERGLLKDTLVICGGEFGRTTYSQGDVNNKNFGRDHHPRCFSIWMAGGGIKGGVAIGKTDDFAYNIVEDPVHVRDIQATLMHQLGVDESKLTFRFQGRDQYLTNIGGKLIRKILA